MSAAIKFKNAPLESYSNIRSEIREGDLFFTSGKYVVSKAIQEVSSSIFSHVGVVLFWKDRVMLAEAVEDDGVRMIPLSHYVHDYENSGKKYKGDLYLARLKNTTFNENKINAIGEKLFGILNKSYDKDAMVKIAIRITLGWAKDDSDDEFICSELVDYIMTAANIQFPRDPKGFIYPEHIAADERVTALYKLTI